MKFIFSLIKTGVYFWCLKTNERIFLREKLRRKLEFPTGESLKEKKGKNEWAKLRVEYILKTFKIFKTFKTGCFLVFLVFFLGFSSRVFFLGFFFLGVFLGLFLGFFLADLEIFFSAGTKKFSSNVKVNKFPVGIRCWKSQLNTSWKVNKIK